MIGAGLLLSAFSPLLVALVLVTHPFDGWWWDVALAGLVALPMLIPVGVLAAASTLPTERLEVRSSSPRDADLLSFMGSSILPIAIALFTPDPLRLAAMGVLLLVLAAVYLGAEQYWLNPMFAVLGYRVHQVVDEVSGATVIVLTRRRRLPAPSRIDARVLAGGVLIEPGRAR